MEEPYSPPRAGQVAPVTTMAMAMMFGTVIFAFVSLTARCCLSLKSDARQTIFHQALWNKKSTALDTASFASLYTLLHHTSVFGLILFYAYICEYHPPYPHANKSYDRDLFFFLTFLLFLASAFTLTKHRYNEEASGEGGTNAAAEVDGKSSDGGGEGGPFCGRKVFDAHSPAGAPAGPVARAEDSIEVLNRDQTEEWKGWMQFMFLLYHYYHAEEVYNSIRIMITCYVWMTGFGNFSFFYIKGDYGFVRVIQMLWRLNFLVTFLCLSQGATYILYYICLLHTFFFLMVYVSMRIGKQWNYTKWAIRQKLAVLAVIIFLVWDVDTGLFKFFHYFFLGETPMLGAGAGAMWEWYFRSSLDHWSTYLGMVFALNFPITSLFFRKLDALPLRAQILTKGSMGIVLFAAFYWWATGPFLEPKLEYNATNAYYGFIPLITYVYFRNISKWLRCHSLELLHQIGKTTLETYLMQHHIWLTSNAKSLLTLIPGYPKINFLVVTFIYFVISRRLYQLTLFLRGMVLPNNKTKCIYNIIVMSLILVAYVVFAHVLKSLHLLNLTVVGIISLGSGCALDRVIIAKTGQNIFPDTAAAAIELTAATSTSSSSSPGSSSPKSAPPSSGNGSNIDKTKTPSSSSPTPLIYGAVAVGMIGILWNTMSQIGAAKIQPLQEICADYVNHGTWIPFEGCANEEWRGKTYRSTHTTDPDSETTTISTFGTCYSFSETTNNYGWGWYETPASTHCRFDNRNAKTLKKQLTNRKLVFVGDSEVRHVYHSLARQMGDQTAGRYDTSMPKHSGMTKTLGSNTQLDFVWSPFAKDQVEELKKLIKTMGDGENTVDLILISSGPWDRLHNFSSEIQKQQVGQSVKELSKLIKQAKEKAPVVWLTPTTINSDALLTDEKKQNLKEEHVQEMRNLYDSSGVLDSCSFVLDGPSFTAGRRVESYDGVHYPLAVYDAGAQILANAMDWLLLPPTKIPEFKAPQPGKMAQPLLGFMMLCLVMIGLFCFDGFFGASYVASLFLPSMMPVRLFEEAFVSLHKEKNLPEDIRVNDPGIKAGEVVSCAKSIVPYLAGVLAQIGSGAGKSGRTDDNGKGGGYINSPTKPRIIKAKYSDDENGIMATMQTAANASSSSSSNNDVNDEDEELVQLLDGLDKK